MSEKAHAELGASSAHRWMACPGSVRLCRDAPNVTSRWAAEGTVAHALAETCLREGKAPTEFLGQAFLPAMHPDIEVTEEMADAVQAYCDLIHDQMKDNPDGSWIEKRFSLNALNPPAPMFGTSDAVLYFASKRRLKVDDLKYGAGVPVEAEGNPQLMMYGLGALLEIEQELNLPIDEIELTIVQPRAPHPGGIARSHVISYDDLVAFGIELLAAAERTMAPDAPLVPGEHCRFCNAAGTCPALFARAQEAAQADFSAAPVALTKPETMTPERLGQLLAMSDDIETWIEAVRKTAYAILSTGHAVPGFKLVWKRATRRWTDEAAVVTFAEGHGIDLTEMHTTKLKTPAQLEKLLPKGVKLPDSLVTQQSSGTTMAPESDKRPAVSAADDFATPVAE